MIKVTKLNGSEFYLNPHLIERLDANPDTVVTMDSQVQYIVKESIDDMLGSIIAYRKKLGDFVQE
jgi:flagellar protein FlbD